MFGVFGCGVGVRSGGFGGGGGSGGWDAGEMNSGEGVPCIERISDPSFT